jgi:asparagine synthase (glutamine-hydrolysing)
MCGIFACLNAECDVDTLQHSFMSIRHRGPDHSILHAIPDTKHILGFHRLAINDLSERGNQPLSLPDAPHLKLICNGEIYNHALLAKIYNFKMNTGSDCEIILHMYQRFGLQRALCELDGYFALVLLDGDKAFVARDPIGIRSLYMGYHGKSVFVASELKAIHQHVNYIFPFPPGSFWHKGLYTRYATSVYHQERVLDDYKTAVLTTQHLLFKAVEKRVHNTERPIGCFLSGGLDSSLVTAITCSLSDKPVHTFSIGMQGSTDLKYARMVADFCKTIHHEIIVTEQDMIDAIPEVVRHIETFDTTTVRASTPMFLLSKYISTQTDIRVVLSGEGSDELSGSYAYFKNAPSPREFYDETVRLINDLHHFDVLRGDKSTAAHGLEIRVPFLDKDFIEYYLHIRPEFKMFEKFGCEKYLLRDAFRGKLPDEVLWRTKEAFSDGVSSTERSWYHIIQEHVATLVLPPFTGSFLPPQLKETLWYRCLFDAYYPHIAANVVPYYWLPKWCGNVVDPSARVLPVYIKKTTD